jgi:FdhD protein
MQEAGAMAADITEIQAEDLDEELSGAPVSTAIVERRQPLRIMSEAGDGAGDRAMERDIAGEVPISLAFNGLAHAVMMITPTEMEDFVYGFAITQEIIRDASEISGIELIRLPIGYLAQITIPQDRFQVLTGRRRNLVGQTGCGLCGLVELDQAVHSLAPIEAAPRISRPAIFRALAASRDMQALNKSTGAMHAAFFVSPQGEPLLAREDVGRHNALDKLIGRMAREGMDAREGFFLLTSRCSYELVEKAVIARAPALVTISAPTSLAVARAEAARLTLVSLARPDSALVFHDPFGVFAGPS